MAENTRPVDSGSPVSSDATLPLIDTKRAAARMMELYGGREKFFESMEARSRAFEQVWHRDSEAIGEVLHAHLVVEHFLARYLQVQHPNLPDIGPLKLSFATKVGMLSDTDYALQELKPGLLQLNTVRNKLAHRIHLDVVAADVAPFLRIGLYTAMHGEGRGGEIPTEPVAALLHFAHYAAMWLSNSSEPDRDLWTQAFDAGRLAPAPTP